VIVTNPLGSVTSSVAVLTVLMPPTILTQPADVATNAGRTVKFILTATGTTPLTNRWWQAKGTTNVPAGTTGTLSNSTLNGVLTSILTVNNVSSNANYYGVVSNLVGVVTSRVASLTITYPPSITNESPDVVTNAGATVFFNVVVGGTPPLTYQWFYNGTDTGAGSVNPLQLDNVTTNNSGGYQVVITNNYGSVTSRVVVLTVGGTPGITAQPTNQMVIQGSNATFSVMAEGDNPLSYQWWFNQTNLLSDATNASYTVGNAQTNNIGDYSVIVTNPLGSVTSSVATLTVLVSPTILTQPVDIVTNAGRTVKFILTATGTTPLTNRWWQAKATTNVPAGTTGTLSNSTLNGVLTSILTVNNASANANYFGVVSNVAGVVTSSVASLTFLYPPVITNQPPDVATNAGSAVFFSVVAGGTPPLNYQWFYNGTDTGAGSVNPLELDNVTTNNNGGYQVIITNNYGSVTSRVAVLIVGYQALTPAQLWLLSHSEIYGDGLLIALEAGKNYRVQSSSNFQNWTDTTNFLSTGDLMVYTNEVVTNVETLFYRVVSP